MEAVDESQAPKFLMLSLFLDQVSVIAEPHATLNSCNGIIYCRELFGCLLEVIKDKLKSQQVIVILGI